MNRQELENMLLNCVREVQELCGKTPTEITINTCPFEDLEAFDSLTAVETTELLSRKLEKLIQKKIHCGKNDVNLFFSKERKRPLNLFEVVNRIELLIEKSNGK